jgi:hypothetical protein
MLTIVNIGTPSPTRREKAGIKERSFGNHSNNHKGNLSGIHLRNQSGTRSSRNRSGAMSTVLRTMRRYDEHNDTRKDIIVEMRLLSKLRHPCITTVMGAVIDGINEPMLIIPWISLRFSTQ